MANTHTQYKSCAHGYVHINEALYTCELKKTLSISTQNNRCSWMGMWSFNVILACMHACIDRYKLFIHEHVTHTCMHACMRPYIEYAQYVEMSLGGKEVEVMSSMHDSHLLHT